MVRKAFRKSWNLIRLLRAELGRWEELEALRRRFPGVSFPHDLVVRAPARLSLGKGTLIEEGVFINCGGEWAPEGYFRCGEDCYIGAHSVIYAAGGVEFGDGVGIAANTLISSHQHPYSGGGGKNLEGLIYKPVRLEGNVAVNMGATVLPGVTIGTGSVVAAQATVTKDVPPGVLVMGTPARIIREL